MIKKLRIKLILVITFSALLIFTFVLVSLNFFVYSDSERETERFLHMIVENDGFFSGEGTSRKKSRTQWGRPGFNQDDMRARRFFFVKVDESGNVFESNYEMMFDFADVDAAEYIDSVSKSGETSGRVDSFTYLSEEKSYGKMIAFAERSVEIGLLTRLTEWSLVTAGISCALLLLLSFLLSKWMVAPIKNAFAKQRRFVSDANHELKTPLTIISANVDVLQNEVGDNTWIAHIRTQLIRMNKLIHHLLTLSKAEDAAPEMIHAKFDLSKAMLSTALEFESHAFEENKEYTCEIQNRITYTGDEERLKQLLGILIDNAITHSGKQSKIKVSLKMEAGRPRLSVYNTGMGIKESERDKIFDRFYRSDDSRARETGGYGLGLSIAKAIVDAHKGKIRIIGEHGKWVEFVVTL
ncbi:MAG: HAMP domain-containing histidine kinase [Clostridium sp.]|jgi:signal transduction histidine kinase|nr:HAMP domain-containing histidine kinase [Clostridium sp.]